jgi:hypothetical protein
MELTLGWEFTMVPKPALKLRLDLRPVWELTLGL